MLDPERPVQFIIAGKAHPADDGGKRLIQQMVQFADDPAVRHRIVFLPDYDMAMARALVQGCDVWLNNPLRPLEASGTSGMKSALNGGLNLSIRDGWWDEWYDGADGWAIPSADGVEDPERRDVLESNALYDLLGLTVAPRFYDTGTDGLPRRWLEMVGHTLRALGPRVQASRMVREYVEELYIPAARASRMLSEAERATGMVVRRHRAGGNRSRPPGTWPPGSAGSPGPGAGSASSMWKARTATRAPAAAWWYGPRSPSAGCPPTT